MVKSLLAGLTILTLSYSANVTISGIVTDTAGTAIAGASVKLLAGGQNTMTGTDGKFTLSGNDVGITVKPTYIMPTRVSVPQNASLRKKFLRLTEAEYSTSVGASVCKRIN